MLIINYRDLEMTGLSWRTTSIQSNGFILKLFISKVRAHDAFLNNLHQEHSKSHGVNSK